MNKTERAQWGFQAGTYDEALDAYRRAKSPFRQGKQRVLNIVPVVINTFAPPVLFALVSTLLTSRLHHRAGRLVEALCLIAGLLPAAVLLVLIRRSRHSFVPSWFKLAFLLVVAAFLSAEAFGWYNYWYYLLPYYQLDQLQSYPNVDVGQVSGRHLQDAGRAYFAAGTKIDVSHSWHFKSGSLYCVAPLIGAAANASAAELVDFWVVGKDCCGEDTSDFRCGEFSNARARSGLRVLENPLLPERHFYNLAVKGAAALFPIKVESPVFFTWVQDPLFIMTSMRDAGWSNLLLANMAYLAANVLAVALSTCGFSYLGREAKPLLDSDDEP